MSSPRNSVRARREGLAWSQAELGKQSQLSRQSVNAIETGRTVPSVEVALRLSRALSCSVEELFAAESEPGLLDTELASAPVGVRSALARIEDRWVAFPLGDEGMRVAADALVCNTRADSARVRPLRPLSEVAQNLVIAGCAMGLGVLADRLNARANAGRFLWFSSSSGAALRSLSRGHAHVAGVHLVDARTGEENLPAVRRAALRGVTSVVTLARWEVGLLLRVDDSARIRSPGDLGARRVRVVVREPDSGAQQLLERELRAAGVVLGGRSPALVASSHLGVARAIAMGAADVGVATRDAALLFGLRFVPLSEERYDLVVGKALLTDARVKRLFDALVSLPVRTELDALGYDVSQAGAHVADVRAS